MKLLLKKRKSISIVVIFSLVIGSGMFFNISSKAISMSGNTAATVVYDGQYHRIEYTISGIACTYSYIDENSLLQVTSETSPTFSTCGKHTVVINVNGGSITVTASVTIIPDLTVTNLATSATTNSFSVSWSRVAGADGYCILYSTSDEFKSSNLGYVVDGSTSYVASNVLAGTVYYVKIAPIVKSFNYDIESYFSDKYTAGTYSEVMQVMIGGGNVPTPSPSPTPTSAPTPTQEPSDEQKIVAITNAFEDATHNVQTTVDILSYQIKEGSELKAKLTNNINKSLYYDANHEFKQPDLFHVDSYQYEKDSITGYLTGVKIIYNSYANQYGAKIPQMIGEMGNTALDILSQVDDSMTEMQKVIAIHDGMIRELDFAYENYLKNNHTDEIHSTWGALVNRKGLCDAYSYVFHMLMNVENIPCEVLYSSDLSHCWNYVQIDGKWYHVDVAWDDLVKSGKSFSSVFSNAAGAETYYGDSNSDYCDEGYGDHTYLLRTDAEMRNYGYTDWSLYYPKSRSTAIAPSSSTTVINNEVLNFDSLLSYNNGFWYGASGKELVIGVKKIDANNNTISTVPTKHNAKYMFTNQQYIYYTDGEKLYRCTLTGEDAKIGEFSITYKKITELACKGGRVVIVFDGSLRLSIPISSVVFVDDKEAIIDPIPSTTPSPTPMPTLNPTPVPTSATPAKGTTVNQRGGSYKVTNVKGDTVNISYTCTNKKAKKVVIASTVMIDGKKYAVTSIANNAFKNCKKLTSITLPKNVSDIGSKAFYGNKNLKSITIYGAKLKSVGKDAFKNISKKATIKIVGTKKQKVEAKKILKKAGFKGKVK